MHHFYVTFCAAEGSRSAVEVLGKTLQNWPGTYPRILLIWLEIGWRLKLPQWDRHLALLSFAKLVLRMG